MHLTGQDLPLIDDGEQNWRAAACVAITDYCNQRCVDLPENEASRVTLEIEKLLAGRIDAIQNEDRALFQRYAIPPGTTPSLVNFDITFRTQLHEDSARSREEQAVRQAVR